jgi:hypothetical protein
MGKLTDSGEHRDVTQTTEIQSINMVWEAKKEELFHVFIVLKSYLFI